MRQAIKTQLFACFSDRGGRLDNTKSITILTFIFGWIVTFFVAFKGSADAVTFFYVMIGAGSGLTVTKGVVDLKQKAQRNAQISEAGDESDVNR
ncbi:hypothetical protein MMG00_10730 [Ignatzschineria rhizosphaerae]|uniref:DUF2644 domain-containing protein n=1 Tax=Ignatzschineria rhizosphaerae TaxID=2923279 RepID=A0ABY3WYJ2_9GAMM|nr:hypothetical protein [Ignatzschineria rhizosphaerae]UNM95684.1 hypothetical protein MMG00_10730 [Ignatzschineria rhizosphaerae]